VACSPHGQATQEALQGRHEPLAQARPFVTASVNRSNVARIMRDHIEVDSTIVTDGASIYRNTARAYGEHKAIVKKRPGEDPVYVDPKDRSVHTNTVECFFSLFKRGLDGTYHSVSEKHLHRYVHEFAFRYNTRHVDDGERLRRTVVASEGKKMARRD